MFYEVDVTLPPSRNDPDVSFIIHAVSFIGESLLKEMPSDFFCRKRVAKA